MRFLIAALLFATLSTPVMTRREVTIHDARSDCGALARTMAAHSNETANPTWLDDFGRANFISGYIQGFVDAIPDVDHSKTSGSVDEVCKYIQEHPEIQDLPRDQGMKVVVHAVYRTTK